MGSTVTVTADRRRRRVRPHAGHESPRIEGAYLDPATREQAQRGIGLASQKYAFKSIGERAFGGGADAALVAAVHGGAIVEVKSEGYVTPSDGESACFLVSAALFGTLCARAFAAGVVTRDPTAPPPPR